MKQSQKKKRRTRMARELGENVTFKGAGQAIRDCRESLSLTVEELASRVRVDKATISRWENNESALSDRAIKRLAKALGMRMEALMLACLEKMQPQLKNSPFGLLLRDLVESIRQQAMEEEKATGRTS